MKEGCRPAVGHRFAQRCRRRGLWAEDAVQLDRAADFNGPVRKVVVSAAAGYLKIRGDESGGVKATGRACASSESLLGKIALESRRENDTVYLTCGDGQGMGDMFSFGRYTSLDLDIIVPRDAQLDVTDSSGDLEMSDVGAARIDDSSGDQLLKNINGDLSIKDSSGEIRVMSVVGNVEVEDSSGNIDIEDARRCENHLRQLRRHCHRQSHRHCRSRRRQLGRHHHSRREEECHHRQRQFRRQHRCDRCRRQLQRPRQRAAATSCTSASASSVPNPREEKRGD